MSKKFTLTIIIAVVLAVLVAAGVLIYQKTRPAPVVTAPEVRPIDLREVSAEKEKAQTLKDEYARLAADIAELKELNRMFEEVISK